MPVETATYISDLNASNPPATDGLAQADEHLRLIKSTIKATFPNIDAPVTVTEDALNAVGSIADNAITNAKLRDSAALSVIGRSANSSGDPADIAASNDGEVLRRSGTSIGFGTIATAGIADDAVTNAKAAHMAESTIKGRAVSAGTGDPTDLTATQATAILNAVVGDSGSGGTKGLVPAPASGDAAANKFLKADGTWTAISASGSNRQVFDASGTWTKPAGSFTTALIEVWGGGGSGGNRATTGNAGGGGGGSYNFVEVAFADLASSETVTVGTGGAAVATSNAAGNNGNSSSFGTWCSAYGGGGGATNAVNNTASGGGGGGLTSSASGTTAGETEGALAGAAAASRYGGAGGSSVSGSNVVTNPAPNAVMGGAGGGGTSSGGTPTNGAGGTCSGRGGAGGAASSTGAATAGTQPAGGGGAARNGQTSGKGGDGRIIVTCY